jgi:hypothetical protein
MIQVFEVSIILTNIFGSGFLFVVALALLILVVVLGTVFAPAVTRPIDRHTG